MKTKKVIQTITLLAIVCLTANTQASNLTLVGRGMLEYPLLFLRIDVYEVSYRVGPSQEEITLDYKRDVPKKYSIEGWRVGLKHFTDKNPKYKEKVNWLASIAKDSRRGDQFKIQKTNNQVSFILNGDVYATSTDPMIAKLAFEPWIGVKPVDVQLKSKLLENSKIKK
jgi:hypothetical protein